MASNSEKLRLTKNENKMDSRTLILVCQRVFSRIVENTLRSEGFANFGRGRLSASAGTVSNGQSDASEVFVLTTDAGSAKRLIDLLRACPIRGTKSDLFELYLVSN